MVGQPTFFYIVYLVNRFRTIVLFLKKIAIFAVVSSSLMLVLPQLLVSSSTKLAQNTVQAQTTAPDREPRVAEQRTQEIVGFPSFFGV